MSDDIDVKRIDSTQRLQILIEQRASDPDLLDEAVRRIRLASASLHYDGGCDGTRSCQP